MWRNKRRTKIRVYRRTYWKKTTWVVGHLRIMNNKISFKRIWEARTQRRKKGGRQKERWNIAMSRNLEKKWRNMVGTKEDRVKYKRVDKCIKDALKVALHQVLERKLLCVCVCMRVRVCLCEHNTRYIAYKIKIILFD